MVICLITGKAQLTKNNIAQAGYYMKTQQFYRFVHLKVAILFISLAYAVFAQSATLINGIAKHSELGQESFIGALFTTNLSDSARDIILSDEEKEIQVRVLANRLSARRFRRMWIEGLAINASANELETHSENMATFSNMLKVTLVRGDIFSVQRNSESVKIIINGTALGEIDDPGFFDLLLRVWIGPVPLSSQYRKDLLVSGEFQADMINEFNSIKPSDERIVNVATALKAAEERSSNAKRPAAVQSNVKKPTIAAPKIVAPTIAAKPKLAPPKPKPKPAAPAPKPEPETKSVAAKPSPPKKEAPQTKPENTAQQIASASSSAPAPASEPESILEEEDEVLTAKTLLVQQLYIADLKRWVYKKLTYPEKSINRNEQGLVRVNVIIDRKGKVQSVDLVEESEYKRLNQEAVKAVNRSSPFPKIPDELTDENYSFSIPIVFKLL